MKFSFDNLPQFRVSKIDYVDKYTHGHYYATPPEFLVVTSELESINNVSRLGLRCEGYVENRIGGKPGIWFNFYLGEQGFVEAQFLTLNSDTGFACIFVDNVEKARHFVVGSAYPFLDGYWGERAQLIYDSTREWTRVQFTPKDCTRFYPDGRKETIPGGWDHEHCSICWASINTYDKAESYGYQDQNDQWVCETCYETYVVPKSLDFIIL